MNVKRLRFIAALAVLVAAGSALAQQTVASDVNSVSTQAQAGIIAEPSQTSDDGSGQVAAQAQNQAGHSISAGKTRAQVRAELVQSLRDRPRDPNKSIYFGS